MDTTQREMKAPFHNALSVTKTNILSLLKDNDKLTALLWFDGADALDRVGDVTDAIRDSVYAQSSSVKRVFLTGYDGEAVEQPCAEVHISFCDIQAERAGTVKIPYVLIEVIVAESINILSDGTSLRHDCLFQEICDTLEGHSVGAVGCVELLEAKEAVLTNNTHMIWPARFKVGELRRRG